MNADILNIRSMRVGPPDYPGRAPKSWGFFLSGRRPRESDQHEHVDGVVSTFRQPGAPASGADEQDDAAIRDRKVLIDADLASIYRLETRSLNQAVKRNAERFPEDFIFQLNSGEKLEVITICDHLAALKFAKSLPYAFTEHGALQVANIFRSKRTVEMSEFVKPPPPSHES